MLEKTGALNEREMREQMLDAMDIERERGITIKAQAMRMSVADGGEMYELNLIDTPGHVDFSTKCREPGGLRGGGAAGRRGARGEAQTVANAYAAMDNNLEIIPVVNKIDLARSRPGGSTAAIASTCSANKLGRRAHAAKTGLGVADVLKAVCERIPPPHGDPAAPPAGDHH